MRKLDALNVDCIKCENMTYILNLKKRLFAQVLFNFIQM